MVDFNFSDEINMFLYIVFEYFFFLVFNIKVGYMILDNNGIIILDVNFIFDGELYMVNSEVDIVIEFDVMDFIFYYEFFDNDFISFDVGLNVKYIDGVFFVEDIDSDI